MVVSTPQDIAARDMRAEKTIKGTLAAENRKMLPKHDFESAFSDDAANMKGLFWNPVEVAEVAWRELLSKLSAVAAISAADDAISLPDDDAISLLDDDDGHQSKKRKNDARD
jgi:hypothetical protein